MLVSTHSFSRGYKRTRRSNLAVWMVAVKEMINEMHKRKDYELWVTSSSKRTDSELGCHLLLFGPLKVESYSITFSIIPQ